MLKTTAKIVFKAETKSSFGKIYTKNDGKGKVTTHIDKHFLHFLSK
jgi:hypothetical protein